MKFGKTVLILLMIFSLLINPATSAALTESELDIFSANNIMFYDPGECEKDPNKTCTTVSGNQITWIGDSLSALAGTDRMEKYFSGVDYGPSHNDQNSYVQSGKAITHDNGANGGPGGIEILKKIKNAGELRSVLVFALGANENWTKSSLDEVMNIASSDTQVLILTSRTINYSSPYHNDYAVNADLLEWGKEISNLNVGDWASTVKDTWYASDGVHYTEEGYDEYFKFIKNSLPKSCKGTLCGSTAREKYWSAISNHFGTAAAAGIMGNIDNEGGYNPVGVESCTYLNPYNFNNKTWASGWSWDKYYNEDTGDAVTGVGAFGITSGRSEYLHHVNDENSDLMEYFKNPDEYSFGGCSGLPLNGAETGGDALLAVIGDTDFDQLVTLEVEWMYKTLEEHWDFDLEYFKNLSDPGEAAVYFLIHYERPADQGPREQSERASAAQSKYNDFKDFSCNANATSTDYSTNSEVSDAKNIKYDMDDAQIEKLLKFAVWKAGNDGNYTSILSSILDDFEKTSTTDKGNSDKLFEYIEDSNSGFIYSEDYLRFTSEIDYSSITLTSEQLQKAKEIIIDGLRTTSGAKVGVSDGKSSNTNYCKEKKKGTGGRKIAEAAALMSWPVQVGQGDDSHAGMCYDGSSWIAYNYSENTCFHNPRPLYKQYWDEYHSKYGVFDIYEDCGFFVATVLHYLEVATNDMWNQRYFNTAADAADKWEKVTDNISSTDVLKPGDIIWNTEHIIIYAGEYGGDYGTLSHASREDRVGAITPAYDVTGRTLYRYIGSDEIDEEDGLTLEQATQFMINYGANKNDSSYNVTSDSWYIDCNGNDMSRGLGGSNCVTFSYFYANKFTSMQYGGGNGNQWVDNAVGKFKRGGEPKVWSVFSWDNGGYGHTGVILGKHDGEWIVGHASCSSSGSGAGNGTKDSGAGFVMHSSDLATALLGYVGSSYAYPDEVDFDAIAEYLETGE